MDLPKSEIKLLDAAKNLFWKYGFRRISVEEIAAEAGLSKMTFYRYFENKLDIAKRVLSKEMEESLGEYQEILDSKKPFTEKIEATILLKSKHSDKIGIEFLQDILSYGGEEFRSFLNGDCRYGHEEFYSGTAGGSDTEGLEFEYHSHLIGAYH